MYLSAIKNSRSILVLLLVLLFSIAVIAQENKQPVSITILYDNYDLVDSELEEDWGFAALIRGFDEVVLFDSGTKPDLMMGNLEKAD